MPAGGPQGQAWGSDGGRLRGRVAAAGWGSGGSRLGLGRRGTAASSVKTVKSPLNAKKHHAKLAASVKSSFLNKQFQF